MNVSESFLNNKIDKLSGIKRLHVRGDSEYTNPDEYMALFLENTQEAICVVQDGKYKFYNEASLIAKKQFTIISFYETLMICQVSRYVFRSPPTRSSLADPPEISAPDTLIKPSYQFGLSYGCKHLI